MIQTLSSAEVAERYAAFGLALDAGDEILKREAIELALASGDDPLAIRAFDEARALEDSDILSTAFDLAFGSTSAAWKSRAVDLAFASDDPALKSKAIELVAASRNEQLIARLPRISQWAERVVEFSSEWEDSSKYVVGAPQGIQPGDPCENGHYWYSSKQDGSQEFIRVGFGKPVRFPEIFVHEGGTHENAAGHVRKLILWDPDGKGTEYPVSDSLKGCPGAAEFDFRQHPGAVEHVTVVIDLDHVRGHWEAVEAVRLVGTPAE
ncbi:MAG: hypothetical protein OXI01_07935 [Albidovulum sp.]|nr:hypothetical protein [Albidovulum sp.]